MSGLNDLSWTVISAIISFFIGLFLDVFLPEGYKIKFHLMKKKISQYLKNPSYVVGISSRIDLKQNIKLEEFKEEVKKLFLSKNITIRGTEVLFKDVQHKYTTDILIQPAYEESEDGTNEEMLVYSINITVSSKVNYRDLRDQVDDLRAILDSTEKVIIKNFSAYPSTRTLYVEMSHLKEFSEILENFKAEEIRGVVRDSNARFSYYKNRLIIENTIDSKTLRWFKEIIAYLG